MTIAPRRFAWPWLVAGWSSVAAGLIGCAILLSVKGEDFEWSKNLENIPALELALGSMASGFFFLALRWLIPESVNRLDRGEGYAFAFAFVVAIGLLARIILLPSVPALEDDFYRYLWDGGVTVAGFNPYARPPDAVFDNDGPEPLKQLAAQSGAVIERVNHPHLKTIYPPVAQVWFAISHAIEPWSLLAWRFVGLASEILSLLLIVKLLSLCKRSSLWSALYWWNPLVIKELTNSAHMEVVLIPVVLLAILSACHQRFVASAATLGIAIGTKLWPVLLLPLALRPLAARPTALFATLLLLAGMTLLWAWPVILGGLNDTSGFVAFAREWRTNSALFQALNAIAESIGAALGGSAEVSGLALRGLLATIVGLVAFKLAKPEYVSPIDVIHRFGWVIGLLVILSPAQFPWYATWILCLMPFMPLAGLFALTIALPLYYVSFAFIANDNLEHYNSAVIWVIWLPIWLAFLFDGVAQYPAPDRVAPNV
ncbi:MAG: hypothetical protein ACR2PG_16795 [Hyphomicrobiaceae bacterium]